MTLAKDLEWFYAHYDRSYQEVGAWLIRTNQTKYTYFSRRASGIWDWYFIDVETGDEERGYCPTLMEAFVATHHLRHPEEDQP